MCGKGNVMWHLGDLMFKNTFNCVIKKNVLGDAG